MTHIVRPGPPHAGRCAFMLMVASAIVASAHGQAGGDRLPASQAKTVTAGARYRASALHRLFFGGDYRDLWTTPITVEVLNLQTVGSGLTPTTAGGGQQTLSLRFRGNDGMEYGFRSVDKDPEVPRPELEGTIVEHILQDQISSSHPAAPAVASVLMQATGILHATPRLVVLPDDPGLGQFRERFAGAPGFFEERAIPDHARPFAGATEIINGDELFERVLAGPSDRVDTRAFLYARLFDLFVGDWDRHRGQWGWARFGEKQVTRWVPIPEDRDYAFVRYDGLLLALGRLATPRLTSFDDDYPNMVGLTWNAQEVDRHFLMELERSVWDSVAAALQMRLTDSAITAAVAAMPREYRAVDSLRFTRALMSRRDKLPAAAAEFYGILAREAAIHATDQADLATVERHTDGAVVVTLATGVGPPGQTPYLSRRFERNETSEIRLYLHGGDDRVQVRGDGKGITLRIIAGAGSDELSNSSRSGGVRFYSSDGDRVGGPSGVKVDRRAFTPPARSSLNASPYRDWGHRWQPLFSFAGGPDVGLFLGAGVYRKRFGFRHYPYASRVSVDAGYANLARTFRAGVLAHIRRANSSTHFRVEARASGIEVVRFHGFGNELPLVSDATSEFYRVNQVQYTVEPAIVTSPAPAVELSIAPMLKYSSTKDQPNRFLATLPGLYGSGRFGQIGGRAEIRIDTRDVPAAATRGVQVVVGGSVYPPLWDVDRIFGEVHGHAATYISATRAPFAPTLAMRVGGKRVFGTYPFQEAAFIGDASTVRLGRQNRFAGDAAVYGNAELRLRLSRISLLLPGQIGVFGLGDIGRVFLEGESSDTWHWAAGGGIWLSFLGAANTFSLALAQSEERFGVYAAVGFAF